MSILEEAAAVINERQMQYGTREENFGRIAQMWTAILDCPVTPQQVALCMIALKVARETFRHSKDNAIDIAGYAHCLEELAEKDEQPAKRQAVDGVGVCVSVGARPGLEINDEQP